MSYYQEQKLQQLIEKRVYELHTRRMKVALKEHAVTHEAARKESEKEAHLLFLKYKGETSTEEADSYVVVMKKYYSALTTADETLDRREKASLEKWHTSISIVEKRALREKSSTASICRAALVAAPTASVVGAALVAAPTPPTPPTPPTAPTSSKHP